jgi:hypothetical protein
MDTPTIRKAYDAVEKRLAPRLEAFVRTSHYAQHSAILVEARTAIAATVDGVPARVLHAGQPARRHRRQLTCASESHWVWFRRRFGRILASWPRMWSSRRIHGSASGWAASAASSTAFRRSSG